LAQDIYDALTEKGYRVFFSRITLEDKLGQEYEPYIFAALNSARIMLVVGTDYEHFNAVWVKNEWSRYLKLMAQDKEKHLIPCYKGIDAYDMPEEFARLQAQDLDKMGAIQDILRGIKKLLPQQEPTVAAPQVAPAQFSAAANFVKRGNLALETRSWDDARKFFDEALNQDAACSDAYLGLALCDEEKISVEALIVAGKVKNKNYMLAKRFASAELLAQLEHLETEKYSLKMDVAYKEAKAAMEAADSELTFKAVAQRFWNLDGYRDSAQLADQCMANADMDRTYSMAKLTLINRVSSAKIRLQAVEALESISGWKDAAELAAKHRESIEQQAKQIAFALQQKIDRRNRLQNELQELEKERNMLSIFNLSRRKEIDDRITALKYELVAMEK